MSSWTNKTTISGPQFIWMMKFSVQKAIYVLNKKRKKKSQTRILLKLMMTLTIRISTPVGEQLMISVHMMSFYFVTSRDFIMAKGMKSWKYNETGIREIERLVVQLTLKKSKRSRFWWLLCLSLSRKQPKYTFLNLLSSGRDRRGVWKWFWLCCW